MHLEVLLRVLCDVVLVSYITLEPGTHLIISRMICIVPMPRMSMMKQGLVCQFPEGRQGRCAYRDLLLQWVLGSRFMLLGRLCDNLL